MSLYEFIHELADRKAKTGEMKRKLFDDITEEKIRSKTTDQAISKTFRLDRLDQIAEQTKPKKRGVRFQIPRINREGGIDYAPEVDPYEDMDVEALLNLQDYIAPEGEKQITKIPKEAPEYEMVPSFWQIPTDPPPLHEEKDPLAIEGPPEGEDEDEDEYVDSEEEQGEEELSEANNILDKLEIPNYDDVEKRLNQPEMNAKKKRAYIQFILNKGEDVRRTIVPQKSKATKEFKAGKITAEQRDLVYQRVDKLINEIKQYRQYYQSKLHTMLGSGRKQRRSQTGRGAYSFNHAKEMLQKFTLIIAEMKACNTRIKMRNMGQTILDALLHAKHINKVQYGQLVKTYFSI